MSHDLPRILVIGAGNRGKVYARATVEGGAGRVTAVAEPDEFKRLQLGRTFIWGESTPTEGSAFVSWEDFVEYERRRRGRVKEGDMHVAPGVDAAFVCVLDEMHRKVVVALLELGGIHIMCEKPLATRLEDCVDIYRSLRQAEVLFAIGHVLRYSPHNIELRRLLLEERVIGDVLSVVHTEPVGWWHFAHSFVRGNWRREDTTAPSLLTKCCHDVDLLLWFLCSSYNSMSGHNTRPHLPSTVTCRGSLQFFKKSRKPIAAGNATNCLSCPIEQACKYSAKHIYVGDQLGGLESGNTGWPVSVVVPDIEDHKQAYNARNVLLAKLAEDYCSDAPDSEVAQRNWFGRCVFECDNDVCDEEVVIFTWDDEEPLPSGDSNSRGSKQAILHMVVHSKKICERYTHFHGSEGEIYADSRNITITDFRSGKEIKHTVSGEISGHGGGDLGLTCQFLLAVDKIKNHGWDIERAQTEIIGCTPEEIIRSHAMVFCAEEARKSRRSIEWKNWWTSQVEAKLQCP